MRVVGRTPKVSTDEGGSCFKGSELWHSHFRARVVSGRRVATVLCLEWISMQSGRLSTYEVVT